MDPSFSRLHRTYLTHTATWLQLLKERLEHVEQTERHQIRHLRQLRRRRHSLGEEDEEQEEIPLLKIRSLSSQLTHHAAQSKPFRQQAHDLGRPLFIDRIAAQYRLNRTEQDILLLLVSSAALAEDVCGFRPSPYDILRVLFGLNNVKIATNRRLFYADSRLRRHNLIQMELFAPTLNDGHIMISERMVRDFLEERQCDDTDVRELEEAVRTDMGDQSSLLQIRKSRTCLSDVQLPNDIKEDLLAVVNQYKHQDVLEQWGLAEKIPYGRALSLLFFGPPGTGKTMTAEAIAHAVNLPLGVVDYSQVMNKWVGESEKYIRKVFTEAKRNGCVLLFDECDSLLQTRIQSRTSVDRLTNNLVNLLLQELEAFEGIVILTTNREDVLDPALERRLALRVPFSLPDVKTRAKLWKGFFTNQIPLAEDVDFGMLAKKYPLPGGDIKNVVLRAVRKCLLLSPAERAITTKHLENAAREELATRLVSQPSDIGF